MLIIQDVLKLQTEFVNNETKVFMHLSLSDTNFASTFVPYTMAIKPLKWQCNIPHRMSRYKMNTMQGDQ